MRSLPLLLAFTIMPLIFLSLLTSSLSLLALLLSILVGYSLYQCFFSPLANVPGPLLAKITRLWLVRKTIKGNFHRDLVFLHSVHGPLVRIAPDELSVAEPTAFKKIYGMRQRGRDFTQMC